MADLTMLDPAVELLHDRGTVSAGALAIADADMGIGTLGDPLEDLDSIEPAASERWTEFVDLAVA